MINAHRYNWARRQHVPLLLITLNPRNAVWRVGKGDSFMTYWYALQPGCAEGRQDGEPFLDVRRLPGFDEAKDKHILSKIVSAGFDAAPARESRLINDHRHFHAQCFAAALNEGLDLAQHAIAMRAAVEQEARRLRHPQSWSGLT